MELTRGWADDADHRIEKVFLGGSKIGYPWLLRCGYYHESVIIFAGSGLSNRPWCILKSTNNPYRNMVVQGMQFRVKPGAYRKRSDIGKSMTSVPVDLQSLPGVLSRVSKHLEHRKLRSRGGGYMHWHKHRGTTCYAFYRWLYSCTSASQNWSRVQQKTFCHKMPRRCIVAYGEVAFLDNLRGKSCSISDQRTSEAPWCEVVPHEPRHHGGDSYTYHFLRTYQDAKRVVSFTDCKHEELLFRNMSVSIIR